MSSSGHGPRAALNLVASTAARTKDGDGSTTIPRSQCSHCATPATSLSRRQPAATGHARTGPAARFRDRYIARLPYFAVHTNHADAPGRLAGATAACCQPANGQWPRPRPTAIQPLRPNREAPANAALGTELKTCVGLAAARHHLAPPVTPGAGPRPTTATAPGTARPHDRGEPRTKQTLESALRELSYKNELRKNAVRARVTATKKTWLASGRAGDGQRSALLLAPWQRAALGRRLDRGRQARRCRFEFAQSERRRCRVAAAFSHAAKVLGALHARL